MPLRTSKIFATEKVSVLASPGKVINEEVGIRTIQCQIRKGGCTTVQRSDWARHGLRTEKYTRGAAYHSTIRKEHGERRMPIDKERDYAVEVQDWRVEKAVRNVRLQAVLLGSNMRFDKRKGIKEKKQEEGQVSLYSLTEWSTEDIRGKAFWCIYNYCCPLKVEKRQNMCPQCR